MVHVDAYSAAVSSMEAHSRQIEFHAKNITNMSTNGHRKTDARFSTVMSNLTGVNPVRDHFVQANAVLRMDKNGVTLKTGRDLDLMIQGKGFLTVAKMDNNLIPDTSQIAYKKDGQLQGTTVGDRTFITDGTGAALMAWKVDDEGNVQTGNNIGSLVPVEYVGSQITSGVVATTQIEYQDVLPGEAKIGEVFRHGIGDILDSGNNFHQVEFKWTKDPDKLKWQLDVSSKDSDPEVMGSFVVEFDEEGNVLSPQSVNIVPEWKNGVPGEDITIDLSKTKFRGTAIVDIFLQPINHNGIAEGKLEKVYFTDEGFLSAQFTNGKVKNLYKIPLTTFVNPESMQAVGKNLYEPSNETSAPTVRDPKEMSFTTLANGFIEGSNVELDEEFTQAILAQRAYGSASRTLSVLTEMMRTAVNLGA